MDSFIPFLRGSEALIPLPTFLGKKAIDPCVERGEASTSRVLVGEGGKDLLGQGRWELSSPLLKLAVTEKKPVLN